MNGFNPLTLFGFAGHQGFNRIVVPYIKWI